MATMLKISCKCGKAFQAKPEMAGKKAKCPSCGNPLTVQKAKTEILKLKCSCGEVLKAKQEHAGKRVRCPACEKTLVIPDPNAKAANAPDEADDPLGLGDFLDEAMTSAPKKLNRLPESRHEQAVPKKKGKSSRSRQSGARRSSDTIAIVAGVACVLHGIGGPAVMFRLVWMVMNVAGFAGISALLMSLDGFVAVASVVAGLGFVACGVGLLTGQPWAGQLGYTLSLIYMGLIGLSVLAQLQYGFGNGQFVVRVLTNSIPQLIVPVSMVYLAQNN